MSKKITNWINKLDEGLSKIGEIIKPGETTSIAKKTEASKEHNNEETPAKKNEEDASLNNATNDVPSQGKMAEVKAQKEIKIEDKDKLLDVVVDYIAELSDDVSLENNYRLVVWLDIDDEQLFMKYDTAQYKQQIQSRISNECGVLFASAEFHMGKPEQGGSPMGRSGKVFLKIIEDNPVQTIASRKASISIFGNAGGLVKKRYVLSSKEMKEKMIDTYNIGAGEFPQVPTGYRENHIAIDDNPNSPMVEKNKFVSRKHAHIGFSEKFGFYLQVELDGTRLMGKRTRIFRGKQIIEMDNPQVKEPLQDGDLIELGKAVILRFVELKS